MAPGPAHQYNDVRLDDRDDRSSTEVESLMEVEKQWQAEGLDRPLRRSRTSRVCDVFNQWRWLIDTTLLLVILACVLRLQTPGGRPVAKSKADEYQLNGDMTDFSPRFDQQIVKFVPEDEYAPYNISDFFKPEVLDKWNQLMPKGMGFQEVKDPGNPKYHDMPTPIQWPDNMTVYTTSMTHQLHCLWAVVNNYALLKTNQSINEDHHWHMIHCFSYMRQAILCSADTALEGLETTFPESLGKGGSDGWDAHHVCKNRNQVHDYLESVRAYDDQEIF